MKTIQVVYNACFGGFSLSKAAAHRLLELGVEEMAEEIKMREDPKNSYLAGSYSWNGSRHDKRLVKVVQELGDDASGQYSELKITTLHGDRYRIDEYDGNESVQQPDDIRWIKVS